MPTGRVGWLRLAGALIASVIGAGFASGQEHLQYFVVFGAPGYAGLALSGALMVLGGGLFLHTAQMHRTRSHRELLQAVGLGPAVAAMDFLLSAAMLAALSVMLAGGGALGTTLWSAHPLVGSLLLAAATAAIVALDLERMLDVNTLLTAILVGLIAVVALGVASQETAGELSPPQATGLAPQGWVPHGWVWAALLYTSYNLTFSFPVFAALGADITGPKDAWLAGVAGGLCLWLLGIGVFAAVAYVGRHGVPGELPMMAAAELLGRGYRAAYAVGVWLALLTTAVADAFALARRFAAWTGVPATRLGPALVALAVPIAQLGFSHLVATAYPLVGYLGAGCLLATALHWGRRTLHGARGRRVPR